jgi:hypothetical protein
MTICSTLRGGLISSPLDLFTHKHKQQLCHVNACQHIHVSSSCDMLTSREHSLLGYSTYTTAVSAALHVASDTQNSVDIAGNISTTA